MEKVILGCCCSSSPQTLARNGTFLKLPWLSPPSRHSVKACQLSHRSHIGVSSGPTAVADWSPPPQRVKGVDWSLISSCCRCWAELLVPQSWDGWTGGPSRTSSKPARAVDFGKTAMSARARTHAHRLQLQQRRVREDRRCVTSLTVTGKDPAAVWSCTVSSATFQDGVTLGNGLVNRQLISS